MKGQFSGIRTLAMAGALLLGQLFAAAQQSHFMYIQSDNKEPFYVLLNNRNFSSSGSGYLIISQIASGQYTFKIGFPKNKYPEQTFTCTIENKDMGFGLKNQADKGWVLVNLQTMELLTAGGKTAAPAVSAPLTKQPTPTVQPAAAPAPKNNNAGQFGDMLSQVVDDPTINTSTTAAAKAPIPVSTRSAGKEKNSPADIRLHKASPVVTPVQEQEEVPVSDTRGIIKAAEDAKKEGRDITFIDFNAKGSDTVKIFIPKPGTEVTPSDKPARKTLFSDDAPAAATTGGPEPKSINNPFYTSSPGIGSSTNATAATPPIGTDTLETTVAIKSASFNSNCAGSMADDNDLVKLRKKMVGAGNEDKMIEVARKAFKSKCYTTEQIKTLGMLFYTDDTRYRLYDAGYPFVSDAANYASLENLLIDDYYKRRFRSMLRQ